jgi:membrane protease YdiL (CAAX protease family)
MFLNQINAKQNEFWKYLVGSLLLFCASLIGQLPFIIGVFLKTSQDNLPYPTNYQSTIGLFEPNLTLFLMLLSFVFIFFQLFALVRFFHKQTFLTIITSRNKIDWNRVVFSFSIWAAITISTTIVFYSIHPQDFIVQFQLIPFLGLFGVGLLLFPFQIGCEELIFRGYLMQGFGNLAKNRWFPLLITSLIFGLLHIANPEVDKMGYSILIYYIGTGLFLGVITLMDDGIELALGFHFANNFIGALLVTSDWTAIQTHSILKSVSDPSVLFDIILPVSLFFPLLIWLFARKYHWGNWRQKLMGNI